MSKRNLSTLLVCSLGLGCGGGSAAAKSAVDTTAASTGAAASPSSDGGDPTSTADGSGPATTDQGRGSSTGVGTTGDGGATASTGEQAGSGTGSSGEGTTGAPSCPDVSMCDDGDPCTNDACDPATGCRHAYACDPEPDSTCLGDGPVASSLSLCVSAMETSYGTVCGASDGVCTPGCQVDVTVSQVEVAVDPGASPAIATWTLTADVSASADIDVEGVLSVCTLSATATGPFAMVQTFDAPAACGELVPATASGDVELTYTWSGCAGLPEAFAGLFEPQLDAAVRDGLVAALSRSMCTRCSGACDLGIACAGS